MSNIKDSEQPFNYNEWKNSGKKPRALPGYGPKGKITEMMAQDRKTGEFYNPQERFDQLMNKPEIMAMLKRLAVR
jgi:hypothetical protein